ncbi:type II toxin-antitoxin system VapC family toxin [Gracilimonas sp.]|uniref:type II toxin-antitoxin system VapC family toxin n=1 Tax=Gracilimonas sp. TaxID=1974203 RepID=UPI00287227B1|nr:PIN domain-containing protein [Gracilimonas sp.]
MAKTVLADTGPIVALIDRRDSKHAWASAMMDSFDAPMVTCTAVITEAIFLLKHANNGVETLFSLIDEGILLVENPYPKYKTDIHNFILKYQNISSSLADLCLIAMVENKKGSKVFTIDSDFLVYRDSKGNTIELLSPYKS